MARLDRQSQPRGDMGSEYIIIAEFGGRRRVSDWEGQRWGGHTKPAEKPPASWAGIPTDTHILWAHLSQVRMGPCVLPPYGDFWIGPGLRGQGPNQEH